jgi:hypothetical protein
MIGCHFKSSEWSLPLRFSDKNFVRTSHFTHAYYMPRPSHLPWLDQSNSIWWTVQTMKLLVMQTSPISCQSSLSGPNIFLLPLNTRAVIAQPVQHGATGWMIGVLWFDSRRRLEIFLFTTTSRTALGPTQPHIQWLPRILSLGVKRPGREADHSPPSSA